MSFELHQGRTNDDWYWRTEAENHEATADGGEGYRRRSGAIHGAECTLAELLRADELDVLTILDAFLAERRPDEGWFSDVTDDPSPTTAGMWQPFIQTPNSCTDLPVWFRSKAECDDFIATHLVGSGLLDQEQTPVEVEGAPDGRAHHLDA